MTSIEEKSRPEDRGIPDLKKRELAKGLLAGGLALFAATNPLIAGIAKAFSASEIKLDKLSDGPSPLLIPQQFNPSRELRNIAEINGTTLNTYLLESFQLARDSNFYLPNNPYIRSEDGFLLRSDEPWTTRLWWPIFDETANDLGQPTLHAEWWPAHSYDLMGGPGGAQKQAQEKAEKIRADHPDKKESAGYCTWVAVSQLLDRKPEAYDGENLAGETGSERIAQLKEGLLVLRNAGAVMVPIKATPEALVSAFVQGLPVVFESPNNWFRSGVGISEDGSKIRATNFGFPHRDFSIREIVGSAYIAFRADSNLTFANEIIRATSFYRFNVDRNFIDQKVYPA